MKKIFVVGVGFFCVLLVVSLFYVLGEPFGSGRSGGFDSGARSRDEIVGNLGGVIVKVPSYYVDSIEYEGRGSGHRIEQGEGGGVPVFRSFGMEVKFPEMVGLKDSKLISDYKSLRLNLNNPWVSVSVNAGSSYPSLGERANEGLAKKVKIKGKYWFENFERASDLDVAGLRAYALSGFSPDGKRLARDSEFAEDVYIEEVDGGIPTYIVCGKTNVPGGVAACQMHFGLEPKMRTRLKVVFYPKLLPKWRDIKYSVSGLIFGFELK